MAEFDVLCREIPPGRAASGFREYQQERASFIRTSYGRFCGQFEVGYDVLVRAVDYVNYGVERSSWPQHRLVQNILIVENLKPLYSAFERFEKGFYEDGFILMRVAYEAFFRVIFLSLHPDDPHFSFADKRTGGKQFQQTNLEKEDLGLDWSTYSFLSHMTHAYKFPVLTRIAQIVRDGGIAEPLTLGFAAHDVDVFSIGVNILHLIQLFYFRVTRDLLLHPAKAGATHPVLPQLERCCVLWSKFFASHVNEKLSRVIGDLDDVFAIIVDAEAGNDWRETRRRLRGK